MTFRNILDWVRRQIVEEVPEDSALCEFDCRKPQCHEGEWASCERRLQRAAGELMPEKKPEAEMAAESTPATPASPAGEAPPPAQPDTPSDSHQP